LSEQHSSEVAGISDYTGNPNEQPKNWPIFVPFSPYVRGFIRHSSGEFGQSSNRCMIDQHVTDIHRVSKKTVQTYFLSELCQISTDCGNFWHKDSKEIKLF